MEYIEIITTDEVKATLVKLMLRREKQIADGITPFVIDKKIASWEKMLDKDYRMREASFRVATANSLAGYEKFKIK